MFKFKRKKQMASREKDEFVDKEIKKAKKALTIIFFIYVVIFLSAIIWYFSFKSTYYISTVVGSSMQPTINPGITTEHQSQDFVYVNNKEKPDHGDIVVIKTTKDNIIKRVIGMEGDKVAITVGEDGLYHVSIIYAGQEDTIVLQEDYIKSYEEWKYAGTYIATVTDGGVIYEKAFYQKFINNGAGYYEEAVNIDGTYFYEIPEDYMICLGDNRSVSNDSRFYGAFSEQQVRGVADIIVRNGSTDEGSLFWKKFVAITSFYWGEIEKLFAR